VTLNAAQAATLKQPNGQMAALVSNLSGLTLNPAAGTAGSAINVSSDGTF
jgi:hypothetical protein